MKVQTSDDVKLTAAEKRATLAPGPSDDYEIISAPQDKYVSLSKLVLLLLAIVATFLACLVFAQDLWGQKNVEQMVHHQAPRVMGPTENRIPLDDFMNDMVDPFELLGKDDDKSDEEPRMMKTTRVTFKFSPKEDDEIGGPFGKKIVMRGPEMDEGLMGDVLKTMMGLMSPEEKRFPGFGDFPFFDGPNSRRPMHPKLVIVRKVLPPQDDGEMFQQLLSGMNPLMNPSEHTRPIPMGFPLLPVRSVQPPNQESDLDSLLEKIFKDMTLGSPMGRIIIKKKSASADEAMSGTEGWNTYKKLVSKLAHDIDTILASTSSLKQTVIEEVNKVNVEGLKQETLTKEQLTNMVNSFIKIGNALMEASIVIKTEDGAMDLVNQSDQKSLASTVESFLKELNAPLGEVFATSTALTKIATRAKIPQPVVQGIVSVATKIVDLGKTVYEDIYKLAGDKAFDIPTFPTPVESSLSSERPSNETEKREDFTVEPIKDQVKK